MSTTRACVDCECELINPHPDRCSTCLLIEVITRKRPVVRANCARCREIRAKRPKIINYCPDCFSVLSMKKVKYYKLYIEMCKRMPFENTTYGKVLEKFMERLSNPGRWQKTSERDKLETSE